MKFNKTRTTDWYEKSCLCFTFTFFSKFLVSIFCSSIGKEILFVRNSEQSIHVSERSKSATATIICTRTSDYGFPLLSSRGSRKCTTRSSPLLSSFSFSKACSPSFFSSILLYFQTKCIVTATQAQRSNERSCRCPRETSPTLCPTSWNSGRNTWGLLCVCFFLSFFRICFLILIKKNYVILNFGKLNWIFQLQLH